MTVAMNVESTGVDARGAFTAWLDRFDTAMGGADVPAVMALVTDDCWWRDLLALSWDMSTYHADRIGSLLQDHLAAARTASFALDPGFGPRAQGAGADATIEGFFTFETPDAWCRGVARLRQVGGEWLAWTVMTGMEDLKGHERALGPGRPTGPRHVPGTNGQQNWADVRSERARYADREPEVVVLGAGQGGLTVAANLGLMGVDTLVLEKSERVGDGWRKRYHSLVLHDPVWADHLPYFPFPRNWPVYSAKDKIADWFEAYAAAMELDVWCSADLQEATYDEASGRWTVRVRTPDGERVLRPRDVILATGAAGEPNVPGFPGQDTFGGVTYHSSRHRSGADWVGKKAVVVGACNSGHDIAQDLFEAGAQVTMVQRSSTYIMSQQYGIPAIFGANFTEDGPPTEYADLLASAYPWPLVLQGAVAQTQQTARDDADLLAALDAVGFQAQ